MKKPNIVCIISDDTDFDKIGAYGSKLLTPNLDQLAAQGVKFNDFYCASSVCTPSRYSFLTGQYCGRCKEDVFLEQYPENDVYAIAWNNFIDEKTQSFPRVLGQNGYKTGYVGKWHTGRTLRRLEHINVPPGEDPDDEDFKRGLEKYQEDICEYLKEKSGFDYVNSIYWDNADAMPNKCLQYHNLEWITKGALDFLDQQKNADNPFLLYMATTVYHGPDHVGSFEHDIKYTHGKYMDNPPQECTPRAELAKRLDEAGLPKDHASVGMIWLDDQIAAVSKKLKEMGVYDDTIIIYHVDHNTEPGKSTCYDKGVRVPFILKWPNNFDQGTECNELCQNIDLAPTLFEACGISPPSDFQQDGESLIPLMKGQKAKREELYFEMGFYRAVKTKKWKYIALRYPEKVIEKAKKGELSEIPNHLNMRMQGQPHISMRYFSSYFDADQLFDLENDPNEQKNLAEDPEYANVLEDMKKRLKKYTESMDHPFSVDDIDFYKTEEYKKLCDETRKIGVDHIPWWDKNFKWPQ